MLVYIVPPFQSGLLETSVRVPSNEVSESRLISIQKATINFSSSFGSSHPGAVELQVLRDFACLDCSRLLSALRFAP